MHYVILDMEWDSAYHKKYKRFVNQILQIGAVKLDEKFNIVDIFDVTIKSSISKRVSGRFTQLTGITKEMMLGGISLSDAVEQYNNWLGDDTVTITWSNSDLYTIAENEKYLLDGKRFKLDKYLDLQVFIQGELRLLGHECKSQIALGTAAELLGITTDNYDLHTAKDDSLLCAALLKKHYNGAAFDNLIKDTNNPEFYKRLYFKPHFISRINDERIDKNTHVFYCEKCENKMKRATKWRYHNNWFNANFVCPDCGKKFVCRVSYKQTFDKLIVKRRIMEPKVKQQEGIEDAVQPVPTTV
ncbi:MAG: exonuclease domain-containing protein [Clostridia bacterium]|nr:exonuclease domain-containing protein [Clostridia bacterium]